MEPRRSSADLSEIFPRSGYSQLERPNSTSSLSRILSSCTSPRGNLVMPTNPGMEGELSVHASEPLLRAHNVAQHQSQSENIHGFGATPIQKLLSRPSSGQSDAGLSSSGVELRHSADYSMDHSAESFSRRNYALLVPAAEPPHPPPQLPPHSPNARQPSGSVQPSPMINEAPSTFDGPPPPSEDAATAMRRMGLGGWLEGSWDALGAPLRGLTDNDCAAIGVVVLPAVRSGLTSINLGHNEIGDAGARALASALAEGASALRRLLLHENHIGSSGLSALATAFAPGGADGLVELRLSFNRIGDAGLCSLARSWAIGGGNHLTQLHAAGNCIGDDGLAALCEMLAEAPRLYSIGLGSAAGGNAIGDDGARALGAFLRMNAGRAFAINLRGNNRLTREAGDELLRAAADSSGALDLVVDDDGERPPGVRIVLPDFMRGV